MKQRLRVIAGTVGSVPLEGPSRATRPTTDRTREVLFSSLESVRDGVEGRPFVDLYAGSGAVGIEALSRGASRCLFVEMNAENVRVIQENLEKTGLGDEAEVWRTAVETAVERVAAWLGGKSAIVFADPPYEDVRALKAWGKILESKAAPGTVFVLEHSCRRNLRDLPDARMKEKQVGETCLSFWERSSERFSERSSER